MLTVISQYYTALLSDCFGIYHVSARMHTAQTLPVSHAVSDFYAQLY